MASVRSLVALMEGAEKKKEEDTKNEFQAKLIRRDGSVIVVGRPQWVNYQPIGGGNPGIAFNLGRVAEQVGIQVIVGFDGDTRVPVILNKDPTAAQDQTMTSPDFAQHGKDHRYMGKDSMAIDLRQLQELMVLPKGSFVVSILAGRYGYQGERKYFGGHTGLDLSLFQPTSGKRAVGLYLDSSNTLQSVNGNVIAESASPIPEPDWPDDCTFQVAICVLHSNKSFIDKEDIKNRKIVWGSETEIPRCLIDAKGDIVVGTADNTVTRLPVGTDTYLLTADSSTTEGVAWSSRNGWPFANVVTVSATDPDADYTTIAAAITAASAGDVIEIDPGVWTEILVVNKAVTLRGRDRDNTTITSSTAFSTVISLTAVGAKLLNLKVTHTGTGLSDICVLVTANDCVIENCILEKSSASNTGVGIENTGGTGLIVRETEITVSGGTAFNRCYGGNTAANDVEFIRCVLDCSGTGSSEISLNHASAVVTITETVLTNGTVTINANLGTFNGTLQDAFLVKNVSGASAAFNDVGYLDEAGEYQTTNTEADDVAWCVVVIGNDDDDNIFIKRSGTVIVNYTGAAPSANDFLITSTTPGSAKQQVAMRPEIFAVCATAGAGGTVEVLLLTNTIYQGITDVNTFSDLASVSDSTLVMTIATLPGGAVLTYNISSGNENTIDVTSTSLLAKIRLFNSTRSTYALISDTVVATNTITLTANVPAGWLVGDTITPESQVNLGNVGGGKYYDLEIFDTTVIPELTRSVAILMAYADSGAAGQFMVCHPWETFANSKGASLSAVVAGQTSIRWFEMDIIERRITVAWDASGAGTGDPGLFIAGGSIAAP